MPGRWRGRSFRSHLLLGLIAAAKQGPCAADGITFLGFGCDRVDAGVGQVEENGNLLTVVLVPLVTKRFSKEMSASAYSRPDSASVLPLSDLQ